MSWLSDRISKLLSERDLAIAGVARDLAIERSQLTQIAAGARTPNEVLTRRIASYFGENPDEWVGHASLAVKEETTPPPPPAPSGFTKVASVSDVAPGKLLLILDGRAVVANVAGAFFAFASICPHAGGNLGEGFLDEYVLECPWHAGRWDIRTGQALTRLATADVERFKVRVKGEDIEVSLD